MILLQTWRVLKLGLLFSCFVVRAANAQQASSSGNFAGWATNGPGVFRQIQALQVLPAQPVSYSPPPLELPLELRRAMATFRTRGNVTVRTIVTNSFDHFLPESLNYMIWTNFIAHTNGRNMLVWSTRAYSPGWPAQPPLVQWNVNSLIWGMKGLTALSPCWEDEGSPGQVPITALTKRHGYARGHSMGGDHVGTYRAGKKVWFLTAQNKVVEMKITRELVRTVETSGRDYTILLFSSDLPDSIQPMRVVPEKEVFNPSPTKYVELMGAPCPLFKTEQTGNVSTDVPPFMVDTFKGGDSGSPNMLPMPGELVFSSGRSTSGATPQMQADIDKLSRLGGLDPRKYQLQWVDLSSYPTY